MNKDKESIEQKKNLGDLSYFYISKYLNFIIMYVSNYLLINHFFSESRMFFYCLFVTIIFLIRPPVSNSHRTLLVSQKFQLKKDLCMHRSPITSAYRHFIVVKLAKKNNKQKHFKLFCLVFQFGSF